MEHKEEEKEKEKSSSNNTTTNNKIRHKESTYRKLYSSLLQRKKEELQLFSSSSSSNTKDFDDERHLLNHVVMTECKNMFFGIATTASIFALLRFGPTRSSMILGATKAKALKQAEIDGRRLGTAGVQQRIAIFIEGTFSLWAGFRAYDYTSQQSVSSYTTVSQIPLCKGRSQISEVLCSEWIDITQQKVPSEFWNLVDVNNNQSSENNNANTNKTESSSPTPILRDEQTWKAIYQFAINCQKRHSYEKQIIRKQQQQSKSKDDDNSPIVLPTKVPENTEI